MSDSNISNLLLEWFKENLPKDNYLSEEKEMEIRNIIFIKLQAHRGWKASKKGWFKNKDEDILPIDKDIILIMLRLWSINHARKYVLG